MSKTKTYLFILAAALVAIALGYILNVHFIKSVCSQTLNFAQNNAVSVTAAVCAFLFFGSKNYWLIIAGCAIATSLIIQFAVIGHGAGLFTIFVRAFAFVVIVYLMNLVKLIVNRA